MSKFRFKQFEVEQQDGVFKVGTDGLLIATWTRPDFIPKKILDIGTGTGLIALVAAQRFQEANIYAIDVNPYASVLSNTNFTSSPWSNRLTSQEISLQDFDERHFDLIISNPPFFENRKKSGISEKDLARHNDSLPFSDIINRVKNLLTPKGIFSIVLPVSEFELFQDLAIESDIFLHRKCLVKGNKSSPVKRIMAEFRLFKAITTKEETLTVERSRHVYTESYLSLVRNFLLHL